MRSINSQTQSVNVASVHMHDCSFVGHHNWHDLQRLSGRNFTLVVSACPSWKLVMPSHVKVISPQEFLSMDSLHDHHAYICPPTSDVTATLRWYQKLKAMHPHSVSACLHVPRWRNMKWRRSLAGLQQIRVFSKGSPVLDNHKLKRDIEVWLDSALPVRPLSTLTHSQLRMQFQGSISKGAVQILIDTGADSCFISQTAVDKLGLIVKPSVVKFQLGDKTETCTQGVVSSTLQISSFKSPCNLHVMTQLADNYDVILGNDWLTSNACLLDFERARCIAHKHGRSYVLNTDQPQSSVNTERTMSALQFKKCMRRASHTGDQAFVVMIRERVDQLREEGLDPDVADLILEFESIFKDELPGLPPFRPNVPRTINLLPGAKPVSKSLYRMSPKELE